MCRWTKGFRGKDFPKNCEVVELLQNESKVGAANVVKHTLVVSVKDTSGSLPPSDLSAVRVWTLE